MFTAHHLNMQTKTVKAVTSHEQTTEGSGYKIHRITKGPDLSIFDPLLLLDYFSSKYPSGFYDHPHRGFEMATYITKGVLIHEDFNGNTTVLKEGDYSWARIGRGVVHSEMPASISEKTEGFLLWINLPKESKMDTYTYKKFESKEIPAIERQGITVKVLAGEAFGLKGAGQSKNGTLILDVTLSDDCVFEDIIPKAWNSLVFVYSGEVDIVATCQCCGRTTIGTNQSALLQVSKEDRVLHVETGKQGARFLLIAGKPLGEPIHQTGPFVMASQQELDNAFEDYRKGINGFEKAKEFATKLGNKMRPAVDVSPRRLISKDLWK